VTPRRRRAGGGADGDPRCSLAAPSLESAGAILPETRVSVLGHPLKTAAGVARSRSVAATLHPAAGTTVFSLLGPIV
jgi:hypothetical protein